MIAKLLGLALVCSLFAVVELAPCPKGCICDDIKLMVDCTNSNLTIVPHMLNPSIKELILCKNKIDSIYLIFSNYRQLFYLDISDNKLVTLSNFVFENLQHLQVLKLSNNHFSTLVQETFTGLKSLKTLGLNQNFLKELEIGVFADLKNLEELDLSNNRIESLRPSTFVGLLALRSLNLRGNRLSSIPSDAVSQLTVPNLITLDISENRIPSIPTKSFQNMPNLRTLLLNNMGIQIISEKAFEELQSLNELRLDGNELTDIPTVCFTYIPQLQYLYIGMNKFKIIKERSFKGLDKLHSLWIDGARDLMTIQALAFVDNPDLVSIHLNDNKNLINIDRDAFSNLPRLKNIYLRESGLVSLDEYLLPWEELNVIDLSRNRWRCDCGAIWMKRMLRFVSVNKTELMHKVVCAEPHKTKDKQIVLVPDEDFSCHTGSNIDLKILIGVPVSAVLLIISLILLAVYTYKQKLFVYMKDKWNYRTYKREKEYQGNTKFNHEDEVLNHLGKIPFKKEPVTEL